jgi:hypothetical protein
VLVAKADASEEILRILLLLRLQGHSACSNKKVGENNSLQGYQRGVGGQGSRQR